MGSTWHCSSLKYCILSIILFGSKLYLYTIDLGSFVIRLLFLLSIICMCACMRAVSIIYNYNVIETKVKSVKDTELNRFAVNTSVILLIKVLNMSLRTLVLFLQFKMLY